MAERRIITVQGIVQGVGFRPHVYRLATAFALDGSVRNQESGLTIDVQGESVDLDRFVAALSANYPPLAAVAHLAIVQAAIRPCHGFVIDESRVVRSDASGVVDGAASLTLVAPDSATCAECLTELFDPGNRRFRYPFLNCTNCGPRFTIVRDVPYDRARTTMAAFMMCAECLGEYLDPADRRFHAQPTACAACGPSVRLVWFDGHRAHGASATDPIGEAATAIVAGRIVAIKGLGGFHLACNAMDAAAVLRLRSRKRREHKPFAVMVPDIPSAEAICVVTSDERALLESRERPIVLLGKRDDLAAATVSSLESIAPRNRSVGVMLPYTPLHHLLLAVITGPVVMTSGNLTDEPIAFDDDDAFARLSPIVDAILTHDRPIATRCDDSVMRVVNGAPVVYRRSRGFAPRPITVTVPFVKHLLAVGGQLKNTFCLARGDLAFLSHHIGDLDHVAARRSFEQGISHYAALVGVRPQTVVHDLHPGYLSTRIAEEIGDVEHVTVQHHHAHITSCMAERGLTTPVIGVAFDGTGLGDDGAIWGGEFLVVDAAGYRRMGHLGYVPLPGGESAIRRPLRMALSHLRAAYGAEMESLPLELLQRAGAAELDLVAQMMAKRVNSPPTSSVGRLFDAVAALIGIRDTAQFEGQAAMELEAAADTSVSGSYRFSVTEARGRLVSDAAPVIRAIVADLAKGAGVATIAGAFHDALARMIVENMRRIREETGISQVALSGGVFQNVLLATRAVSALETAGFDVFTQRTVPCNDGGLSLGQAYAVALHGARGQLQLCTAEMAIHSPTSSHVPTVVTNGRAEQVSCA